MISLGDGVDTGWLGRAVVAHTGGRGGSGGYAEQAAVPAGELIPVPDGLGLPEAAALLHDGSTAVGLLEETGVQPGEHVLVTAAAGGMGVLLVQLARAAGGQVIGAARGERKLAAVRQAGGQAVDYSEPGWTGRVLELTGGQGVDVVFDGAGGELGAASFGIIARGGRFSAHGMSDGGFARLDPAEAGRRGVTVTGIGEYEPAVFRRRAAAALAAAADGRIRPVIGQEYPLAGAAAAHAALESRTAVAKTLLRA